MCITHVHEDKIVFVNYVGGSFDTLHTWEKLSSFGSSEDQAQSLAHSRHAPYNWGKAPSSAILFLYVQVKVHYEYNMYKIAPEADLYWIYRSRLLKHYTVCCVTQRGMDTQGFPGQLKVQEDPRLIISKELNLVGNACLCGWLGLQLLCPLNLLLIVVVALCFTFRTFSSYLGQYHSYKHFCFPTSLGGTQLYPKDLSCSEIEFLFAFLI